MVEMKERQRGGTRRPRPSSQGVLLALAIALLQGKQQSRGVQSYVTHPSSTCFRSEGGFVGRLQTWSRGKGTVALLASEGPKMSAAAASRGSKSQRRRAAANSVRRHEGRGLELRDSAAVMLTQKDKEVSEDSFFVHRHDLGVFDGVGGWKGWGYDPAAQVAEFTSLTAANVTSQRILSQAGGGGGMETAMQGIATFKGVDLKLALEHAQTLSTSPGTCTACLVSFDGASGLLTAANIGDCGLMLIRFDMSGNPYVALRSTPLQHRFNVPFQLGANGTDSPFQSQTYLSYTQAGDVCIVASDGLFDNLFDEDIVGAVQSLLSNNSRKDGSLSASSQDIAEALAQKAYDVSLETDLRTPWMVEAALYRRADTSLMGRFKAALKQERNARLRRAGRGQEADDEEGSDSDSLYTGGKEDDVTVIVAQVAAVGEEDGGGGRRGGGEEEGEEDGW